MIEVFQVTGLRPYRGHDPGCRFSARLDPGARRRALARGDIRVIEEFVPVLPPGHKLPPGWADRKHTIEAPEGASHIERTGDGD